MLYCLLDLQNIISVWKYLENNLSAAYVQITVSVGLISELLCIGKKAEQFTLFFR
jgi:hypothetical protein